MKDAELLEKFKSQRLFAAQQIETAFGDILDAADVFHYYIYQWHDDIDRNRLMPDEVLVIPLLSREAAVQKMAQEVIETSCDFYNSLRVGLERPMQWMLRKQYEARTNALFFRLDESGHAAYRYLHWQLAADAKLNPDDERTLCSLDASLNRFGDKLKDRVGQNREHWAELPDGRKYYGLGNRAEFVKKAVKSIWSWADLSDHDLDRIADYDLNMYRSSNTIVHPSVIGRLNMSDLHFGMVSNNRLLLNTLTAYRELVLQSFYPSEFLMEDIQWYRVMDAYYQLSLAIMEIPEKPDAG